MYALGAHGSLTITQLAALLRQSHPLIITWVRQLNELGLVRTRQDDGDRRRTNVSLTAAGKKDLEARKAAEQVIASALRRMFDECEADIFDALWRLEEGFRRKPFVERLRLEARSAEATPTPGGAK
jgi:DNA-binding MarR family transcriptional regulator